MICNVVLRLTNTVQYPVFPWQSHHSNTHQLQHQYTVAMTANAFMRAFVSTSSAYLASHVMVLQHLYDTRVTLSAITREGCILQLHTVNKGIGHIVPPSQLRRRTTT
eukprot:4676378-Amphidinium_carterae.1